MTVVVVKPVCPLLPVTVYQPFGPMLPQPLPPQLLPPHPAVPPHGPQLEHDCVFVVQLENSEHREDCKLETVAYWLLGHAVETQLATDAVLVQ